MDLTAEISGTEYRAIDGYSIKEQVGQTAASSLSVALGENDVPVSQQLIQIFLPDSTLFYTGIIQTVEPPKWSSGYETYICKLTFKTLDVIFDQRIATIEETDIYIHEIVNILYDDYLAEENVSKGSVSTILIAPYEEYSVSNSTLRSILDEIGDDADAVAYIDCNRTFYFKKSDEFTSVTPPAHLTKLKKKETGTNLVTVQHVAGSTDETATRAESTTWESGQTLFQLTYYIGEMTGVSINGSPVQVGTDPDDTANVFTFEYGSNILTLNTSATTQPEAGDIVAAAYEGYSEINVTAENTSLISTIAALNGTSGKIEAVKIDSSITSEADGETIAQSLLDNSETREETITCEYHATGLGDSPLLSVWTLSYTALGISGDYVVVERTIKEFSPDEFLVSVKLKNKGFYSRYGTILKANTREVTALAAKSNKAITTYTWVKYSANADGSGMTDAPVADSTKYIGIAANKASSTESTDPLDYTWSEYVGDAGYGAYLTISNYNFKADSTGYVTETTITAEVKIMKGGDVVGVVVGRLVAPDGMTIQQTGTEIQITAQGSLLAEKGTINVPVSIFLPVSGYVFGRDPDVYGRSSKVYGRTVNSSTATSFELYFSWTKTLDGAKGETGAQGEQGEQGVQAYTYRGRFYDDFPGSLVANDFWLVYWEDAHSGSETYTRGIWTWDGTNYTRVSDDSGVNSPYFAQALGDILWAVNNGYGSVSDYGSIDYIDNLVANNAFISQLGAQQITLSSTGKLTSIDFVSGVSGVNIPANGVSEMNALRVRGFTMPSSGSTYTVTVAASGGDYTTVSAALEDLSRSFMNFKNGGISVTIEISDGFVIEENIEIVGINLGWITIYSATTSTIYCSIDSPDPLFSLSGGAVGPVLNIRNIVDTSITDYSEDRTFLSVAEGSYCRMGALTGEDFTSLVEIDSAGKVDGGTLELNLSALSVCGATLVVNDGCIGYFGRIYGTTSHYPWVHVSGHCVCQMYNGPSTASDYFLENYRGIARILYSGPDLGNAHNVASTNGGETTMVANIFSDTFYNYLEYGAIVRVQTNGIPANASANISPNTLTANGIYWES